MSDNEDIGQAICYLATPSVRISCKRILKYLDDSPQLAFDAEKVAMAMMPYLDDTEATQEWMIEIGAIADMEHYFEELFTVPSGYTEGQPVPKLATRGAVRALCSVLRIPIKEKP